MDLTVVPNPDNLDKPQSFTSRKNLFDAVIHGKVCGSFAADTVDMASLPDVVPAETPPITMDVVRWLRGWFGEAVYIQSLVPRPLPGKSGQSFELCDIPGKVEYSHAAARKDTVAMRAKEYRHEFVLPPYARLISLSSTKGMNVILAVRTPHENPMSGIMISTEPYKGRQLVGWFKWLTQLMRVRRKEHHDNGTST
jgi:hypothetical protein